MPTTNFIDVSTGLTTTVSKRGGDRIQGRSSGRATMNVSESAIPLATGYYGNKVARLMQKITLESERVLTRNRPVPQFTEDPNPFGFAFPAYQAWVEVNATVNFTQSWYWEIDGEIGPSLDFTGWRTDFERLEVDVAGCEDYDDYPGVRLHKTGRWVKVSATRYVRPILADPSLALAAFEVYEAGQAARQATHVIPVVYSYTAFGGHHTVTTPDAYSIEDAWALLGGHDPEDPPFFLSDMVLGESESLPPADYSRYLVLLTTKGQTKYLIASDQRFEVDWIAAMKISAAQPVYAPKSYSASMTAALLTRLLPRYGGSIVFDIGEADYRPAIDQLKSDGHSMTFISQSAYEFVNDGTKDYGEGRPYLVGNRYLSKITQWRYRPPSGGAGTVVTGINEYAAWVAAVDTHLISQTAWQDAYYQSMSGGYLYVGASSPEPNVNENGDVPEGGWPTAPIVSRTSLRDRLDFAVPGYPKA